MSRLLSSRSTQAHLSFRRSSSSLFSTWLSSRRSKKRSLSTTVYPKACPRRFSRRTCRFISDGLVPWAATAALSTQILARVALKSEALSAVRRRLAAAASLALTPGSSTCAEALALSTSAALCLSPRASSSMFEFHPCLRVTEFQSE